MKTKTAVKKTKRKLPTPIRKWVEALESGEFKHSKEVLQGEREFCCLGVACVVAEKARVPVVRWKGPINPIKGTNLSYQPAVQKWLGVSGRNWMEFQRELIDINDHASRNPFKKIARIIRERVESGEVVVK